MKKTITILLLIILFVGTAMAQQRRVFGKYDWRKDRHKVYLALGASEFYGDFGGLNKIGSETFSLRDFDIQAVRPAVQIGYIYRFSRFFASRSSFDYIWLSGNDKWTKETFRRNRNLNFRTATYGLSSSIVFLYDFRQKTRFSSLHRTKSRARSGFREMVYTPYIQAGVGGFYFNSKGKYNGEWYKLKPLCTEGQTLVPTRKKYSSVQLAIPVGVGFRIKIAKEWEIGLEYSQWITFTDYIDDCSTTYFDENALLQNKGQLAVDMANPAIDDQVGMPLYPSTRPGQQRGDPRDNDHMIGLFFTVCYSITEGYTPKLRF